MTYHQIVGMLSVFTGLIVCVFPSKFSKWIHGPNKGFGSPTLEEKFGPKKAKILAFIFGFIFILLGIFAFFS